jgi:tRNA pseudouridine38-40 synthase
MDMLTYKMTIAYDGTNYSGWQTQLNAVSIQSKIEEAIKTLLRHEVRVIGSGRTDAGVHALNQTAHFHCLDPLDLYRFQRSINGILPQDIRVKSTELVPSTFHAQYSATGKIYHYHLCFEKVQSPFQRLYSYQVREKIDLDSLKAAAQLLVGTHDFTSFANEAHLGSASVNPVRNLVRLDVIMEEDGVRLEFEADGFLYKMVRNLVGTLLEIGAGKYSAAEIPSMFKAKDRTKAGKAAPPHGLFLVKVHYPALYSCSHLSRDG